LKYVITYFRRVPYGYRKDRRQNPPAGSLRSAADKIISADILPGETISLRELAQKFGVSLMPVREALWQLESERIIVIESNKRIQVNTLTAKEMEEALRLRLMLESTAAERACDLRPESALPKLRKQLEALQGAADRPKIFMRRNSQFTFPFTPWRIPRCSWK